MDNPGVHDDEEADTLVEAADARRVRTALAELGYVLVPEAQLWEAYDGPTSLGIFGDIKPPSTWYARFFDYL